MAQKSLPHTYRARRGVGRKAQISAWTENPYVIATKFQPEEKAEIPHVIGPDSPSFLNCNYLYSRTSLCFHLGLLIYSLNKNIIHPPYNRNKKIELIFSILVIVAKKAMKLKHPYVLEFLTLRKILKFDNSNESY